MVQRCPWNFFYFDKNVFLKTILKNMMEKIDLFLPKHPPVTHECPQKFSAHLVQPAIGNIYLNVLFYYIDNEKIFLNELITRRFCFLSVVALIHFDCN